MPNSKRQVKPPERFNPHQEGSAPLMSQRVKKHREHAKDREKKKTERENVTDRIHLLLRTRKMRIRSPVRRSKMVPRKPRTLLR